MDKKTFFDLANQVYALHKAKSNDYGDERVYFPLGHASYTQMLHVKATRLVALQQSNQEPNFESIKDTVLDMLNYSFFYLAFLEDSENE